jgi:hypothetical protein
MVLLIKLILSHLLGDFLLQPARWVQHKENKKLRAWQFYIHLLIHFILLLLIVANTDFIMLIILIAVSHGIIDALKLTLQKENTKRLWFALDQILHISAIVILWYLTTHPTINLSLIHDPTLLIIATAVTFITLPTSVIIKNIISRWVPTLEGNNAASLQDAGKYIGILERLFVLTFILLHNWEAIGFLIAAKSVFRFGDLKDAHELKLTEYVLIGTLLSFGMAAATGLLVLGLLQNELIP